MYSGVFQGFVISNWEGIDRIASPPHANYSYSVEAGVGAGIDMVSEKQLISKFNMINLLLFLLTGILKSLFCSSLTWFQMNLCVADYGSK